MTDVKEMLRLWQEEYLGCVEDEKVPEVENIPISRVYYETTGKKVVKFKSVKRLKEDKTANVSKEDGKKKN